MRARRRRSEKNTIVDVAVFGRLIRAVPRLGAASNGRARLIPAIIIIIIVIYINLEIIIIHIVGRSVSLHS